MPGCVLRQKRRKQALAPPTDKMSGVRAAHERAAWIMAALGGVGSGAAAASGSAKTLAASTVDALSMSRLESLLSRMFGPAPVDWMRPHIGLRSRG